MEKTSIERIQAIKNYIRQTNQQEGKTVEEIRRNLSASAGRLPVLQGITVEQAVMGGALTGEWIKTESEAVYKDKAILYYHGGGFISSSCETYRDLASRLAMSSGIQVLVVEYRLAPEYPYPAANDDCLFAYQWLLDGLTFLYTQLWPSS